VLVVMLVAVIALRVSVMDLRCDVNLGLCFST
jgi:hypothetical protein